jgi:Transposase IS66 family
LLADLDDWLARKGYRLIDLNETILSIASRISTPISLAALLERAGSVQTRQPTMTRQVLRLEKAGPLLEQIKAAIVATRIDALPKSPLTKACNYILTLWQRLTRFLDYPVLELSNKLSRERDPVGSARTQELDPRRKQGGRASGSSDHLSGRNLPAAQNTCLRLSGFRPAGIG